MGLSLSFLLRLGVSALGGLASALFLLWLMQAMVMGDDDLVAAKAERPVMEFVRLKRESQTRLKQREKPEEPPPPEAAPPQMPELKLATAKPRIQAPAIDLAVPDLAMSFDGPFIGAVRQGPPDRDFMVVSRIPPRYPYQAERRKIEGWVKVSFEITEQGTVKDAVVIAAEPEGVFDQAALQAILKWKFQPRIVDGKAVAVRADQVINFQLDEKRR